MEPTQPQAAKPADGRVLELRVPGASPDGGVRLECHPVGGGAGALRGSAPEVATLLYPTSAMQLWPCNVHSR